MQPGIMSKTGIAAVTLAAVGLCAWSGPARAQSGVQAAGGQIYLTTSPASLGAPAAPSGRVEMALRPGSSAQKNVERIVFSEMMFANHSDELSDMGVGRCYLVAQKLKRGIDVRVVIPSHGRVGGSPGASHELGLKRAEAVKQQLENFGIAESRMSAISFGKAATAAKADWARAVNERAEFEVEAQDQGTSSNENPEPVDQSTL